MKAEVLAEWRTRLADRTLITLPAGAVERLLDEREDVLRELLATHSFLKDIEEWLFLSPEWATLLRVRIEKAGDTCVVAERE